MTTLRVVLADDETMFRGALASLLSLEGDLEVVATASDGAEALNAVVEHRPDVCILDLEMPVMDGIEAAQKISKTVPCKIVICTRHARPGVLRRALATGVTGFVPKSMPAEDLADVIRSVAKGQRYIDHDIAASALGGEACPLTERELDVLRVSRQVDSVEEIAEKLHLARGTVRNYLSQAMQKLGASSRAQAARYAWEQGWI